MKRSTIWEKLMAVDPRIIYAFMAAAVVVPMLLPELILPVIVTDPVRSLYEEVEKLPEGSRIFVTMDFEPTHDPEMSPITVAFLEHCFRKKLQVTGMTLWPQGVTLGYENMKKASRHAYREVADGEDRVQEVEVDAREYVNWVFLGAQPGG